MSLIHFTASMALIAAGSCVQQAACQGFSSPTQTSVTVGGTPQRQGVGAAILNNMYHAYFASTDGYLSVARDTSGNLTFQSVSRISTPQGNIATSLNPAAAYLGGIMYVAYIANNGVYIMNSNDGINFTNPVNIPVPNNVKIDGSLTIAAAFNSLYLGLHDGTNQSLITCSLTLSFAPTCYRSPQGSTYGPGVAYFNGSLWAAAQSNNSAHTLVYGNQSLNSQGQITGPMQFNQTGGNSDQTSAQPALLSEDGLQHLVFGFRSNDASAHFLYKVYNATSGTWSSTTDSGYSMIGSPDLAGSYTGNIADINFFVQSGRLTYSYASAPQ